MAETTGGGLESLLQNKLFLQYLSAAGSDLSTTGQLGAGVAGVTSQNIQSQNFMKLLQQMLGGQVPGGKLSADDKGIKFDVPKSALGDTFNIKEGLAPTNTPVAPTGQTLPIGGQVSAANPFAPGQLDINAADLAGLTTQDISSAIGMRMQQDQLGQKRISDVMDMLYKGQMIQESAARTRKADLPEPLDEDFPITHPTGGQLTHRQWQTLPDDEKRYAIYVHGSKQLGDKDIMTKNEFESLKPTDREKLLRAFERDPKLLGIETGLRKAGATKIDLSGKLEEKKAMSELSGQLYFNEPKWTDDLNKHIGSADVQDQLFKADNPKQVRSEETVKFIENKISAGGGKVEAVRWAEDGKTMIWKVRWPSGDVKEIKYGVRS